MSDSHLEHQPSDEAGQDKLRIHEVCSEILSKLLPNKIEKSVVAKQTIEAAVKQAGLDGVLDSSMYLVSDSFFDGVPSYRLRLVPQELRKGIPFYNEGEIQSAIINVPFSHLQDPTQIQGIEMSFITFYVDSPEGVVQHRYVITPTRVRTYTDNSTLDFYYNKTQSNTELDISIDGVEVHEGSHAGQLIEEEQLYIAGLLYVILDGAYVLGKQSRQDKTMGIPK